MRLQSYIDTHRRSTSVRFWRYKIVINVLTSSIANDHGQLGLSTSRVKKCNMPKTQIKIPINANDQLESIYCGFDTCCVISSFGKVFVWGTSACTEVSLRKLKCLSKCKQISCALDYTLILDENGNVTALGKLTWFTTLRLYW